MNETARKVLQDDKERWVNFRIEKEEQIHKMEQELEVQREHLRAYDRHITALQEALEND